MSAKFPDKQFWQLEEKKRMWDKKGRLQAVGSISLPLQLARIGFCPASLYTWWPLDIWKIFEKVKGTIVLCGALFWPHKGQWFKNGCLSLSFPRIGCVTEFWVLSYQDHICVVKNCYGALGVSVRTWTGSDEEYIECSPRSGITNVLWKGPDSKYFRLVRTHGFCQDYSTQPLQHESSQHPHNWTSGAASK